MGRLPPGLELRMRSAHQVSSPIFGRRGGPAAAWVGASNAFGSPGVFAHLLTAAVGRLSHENIICQLRFPDFRQVSSPFCGQRRHPFRHSGWYTRAGSACASEPHKCALDALSGDIPSVSKASTHARAVPARLSPTSVHWMLSQDTSLPSVRLVHTRGQCLRV